MVPELIGQGAPVILAGAVVWAIRVLLGQLARLILGAIALEKAEVADVPAVMEALAQWEATPRMVKAMLGSEPTESQSQE